MKKIILKNVNNFVKNELSKSRLMLGDDKLYKNEKLTVCIPTFGRPQFIKDAIQSVLNQKTECPFKVVVVDNDPDVNNTFVFDYLCSLNDSRILYYRNENNIGMYGNWNRAIELAKTEYCCLLHDDDLLKDNYINYITKLLRKKKNIDAVCMSYEEMNSPYVQEFSGTLSIYHILKRMLFCVIKLATNNRITTFSEIDNYYLLKNIYGCPTCGLLLNRSSFLESGGYDNDYNLAPDWGFMMFFSQKYKVYKCHKKLGCYRWGANASLNFKVISEACGYVKNLSNLYSQSKSFFCKEIQQMVYEMYIKNNVKYEDGGVEFSVLKYKALAIYQKIRALKYLEWN